MPNFDRSAVKHGTQNIQNDCHHQLSDSFKVHQIRFRPGLSPGPQWGSLQRSADPLAGLRGKGRGGKGNRERRRKEEGDGKDPPPSQIPWSAPGLCRGSHWCYAPGWTGRHSSLFIDLIPLLAMKLYWTECGVVWWRCSACNRVLTALSGRIVSPRWPGNYPNSANCQVRINTPPGNKLALFFAVFRLERHSRCNYDYLKVPTGVD